MTEILFARLDEVEDQVAAFALLKANNLSDLPDVAVARTNLGGTALGIELFTAVDVTAAQTSLELLVGTDVQAYDAQLDTWAGVTPGTGVAAALAVNIGSAGAPVLFNGALGTPSSGVGTNITGVNAATLGGATFAAPGAIGGGTAAAGTFTTLVGNTSLTTPLILGGTAAGSDLTINATSSGAPSSANLLLQTNQERVGIGTTAPLGQLHVGNGVNASTLGAVPFQINTLGLAAFAVVDQTNSIEFGMFTNATGGGIAALGTRTTHPLWIQIASNNRFQFGTDFGFTIGDTSTAGANSLRALGSSHIAAGTAVPAGGTAGVGYRFSSTSNLGIFFGSGAPTLSAAQGSLYVRTDGSTTATRLYVNTNGTTGWTNFTSAT